MNVSRYKLAYALLAVTSVLVILVALVSVQAATTVTAQDGQPNRFDHLPVDVRGAITQTMPSPRYGHTITEVDGQLYMFGGALAAPDLQQLAGAAPANVSNELWRWDKAEQKWVAVNPPSSPPARSGHAAATSDSTGINKMYVFHGEGYDGSLHADIWSYNPSSSQWAQEPIAGDVPSARSQHSTVKLSDGRIMLFGGLLQGGATDENVYIYDPSTGAWVKQGNSFPAGFRYGHSAGFYEGKVYIFGGTGPDGVSNTLWKYDPAADSWMLISPMGPSPLPRQNAASASSFGVSQISGLETPSAKWWIIGGEDEFGLPLPEVWEFDFVTSTWTPREFLPQPRTHAAAATIPGESNSILIFGGLGDDGQPMGETLIYHPEGATCIALSEATIAGPPTSIVGTAVTFTAEVEPPTTTLPITYTWEATEQADVVHTGGLSDTVDFTWAVTGTKTVTVTAENCGGVVSATHAITVEAVPDNDGDGGVNRKRW